MSLCCIEVTCNLRPCLQRRRGALRPAAAAATSKSAAALPADKAELKKLSKVSR